MAREPSLSNRSSPSLRSVTSSAARSVKKAVTSLQGAVKKGVSVVSRPSKKARSNVPTSSNDTNDASRECSVIDVGGSDDGIEAEPHKETAEEELKRLQATWRSPVYGFFKSKVEIGYDKEGRKYHFFKCAAKRCKAKVKGVRRYQTTQDRAATSNLKAHATKCFGADVVEAAFNKTQPNGRDKSIFAAFARSGQQAVTFSHRAHTTSETRAYIARWCTESNRPLEIVKDRMFEVLMKTGRPGSSIPSPDTVTRDIKLAFERTRARVDKLLKEHSGLVHFATDAWTSTNHRAFVAWTVHLHHEGHILSFVMDIIEVPESHTGEALAHAFHKMLIEHRLEDKILAFNGDNATSNDKQTVHLHALSNSFDKVNRVRCFNHTMQLSAKRLLKPFTSLATADNTEGDGDSSQPISDADVTPAAVDGVGFDLLNKDTDDDQAEDPEDTGEEGNDEEEEDHMAELSPGDNEELLENTATVRVALDKIRKLSFAVLRSTTIALPAWRKACSAQQLPIRLIPRDVKTRWNSTYDMLQMAMKYRPAIDDITANKSLRLRQYELDDEDWDIVADLLRVLKIYKDATLFFSQDTVTTIAHVIPTMDRLDAMLSPSNAQPLTPSVKYALKFARASINKYYSKTDTSNVYRIAIVLHPNLKLKYFHKHGWEKRWIDTAEAIVREEFEKYAMLNESEPTKTKCAANLDEFTDFLDIPMDGIDEHNELDDYLSQPLEKVRDPIAWWWEHRVTYPRLSAMAFDYLSIPATSTAVERLFSQGRQLLHFTRSRLSPAMIRAFLCLGDWGRKDLVDMVDIAAAIRKSQLGRKRAVSEADSITDDNSDTA